MYRFSLTINRILIITSRLIVKGQIRDGSRILMWTALIIRDTHGSLRSERLPVTRRVQEVWLCSLEVIDQLDSHSQLRKQLW